MDRRRRLRVLRPPNRVGERTSWARDEDARGSGRIRSLRPQALVPGALSIVVRWRFYIEIGIARSSLWCLVDFYSLRRPLFLGEAYWCPRDIAILLARREFSPRSGTRTLIFVFIVIDYPSGAPG